MNVLTPQAPYDPFVGHGEIPEHDRYVAEGVTEALDLNGWRKFGPHFDSETMKTAGVCLAQAMSHVRQLYDYKVPGLRLSDYAIRVCTEIESRYPSRYLTNERSVAMITSFNDHRDTTEEDVKLVVKAARRVGRMCGPGGWT